MKIIKSILLSLLFIPALVFAQAQPLPNAGLTPESPFYFLDKLGETLQEFFTFNPESKARLQVAFVTERVAEVKIILETKGVEAKGLEVAKARLQKHLGDAAEIVIKQKGKGKDVSKLAKELNDKFEKPKSALADSFKVEKRALKAKEDELKIQLKAARQAGDIAKEEVLMKELDQIKAQKELLELKKEKIEDELEVEKEKIKEEMKAQHKAEKAIREAEEEKLELVDKAAEEGVELLANVFAKFDSLLTQAKNALQAGLSAEDLAQEDNFVEAKNFAKRAEKSLDQIEKTIKELDKKQEKKEEAGEAIKEAEEEKQEVLSKASKDGVKLPVTAFVKFDRLLAQAKELFEKKNYEGAKQLAKQAEKALLDIDKEIEKLDREKGKQKKLIENKEETTEKKQPDLDKQFSDLKDELMGSKASGMLLKEEHYYRILSDLDMLLRSGYPKNSIDELRKMALDLVPYLKDKKTPVKKDESMVEPQPSTAKETPKSIPITTPNFEEKPVLKNLIVEIEPYDKSLGRAGAIVFESGDDLAFATFGEVVKGPEGAKTLPTFEYHTVPNATVFAAADGVIMDVHLNSGWNDYEILITPNADSYWQVWYDHVQNVSLKKGDYVTAGQKLGTSGIRSQTAGRTELMVRYSNWRAKETYTICPFSVFDLSLSSTYQKKISQLMQDWEDFKSNSLIYNQGSHIYPGCQQKKIEE